MLTVGRFSDLFPVFMACQCQCRHRFEISAKAGDRRLHVINRCSRIRTAYSKSPVADTAGEPFPADNHAGDLGNQVLQQRTAVGHRRATTHSHNPLNRQAVGILGSVRTHRRRVGRSASVSTPGMPIAAEPTIEKRALLFHPRSLPPKQCICGVVFRISGDGMLSPPGRTSQDDSPGSPASSRDPTPCTPILPGFPFGPALNPACIYRASCYGHYSAPEAGPI